MDWPAFLTDNYIHYVTSGKNTGPGWISIKCPICGDNDPSQHMGLNLTNGTWSCWRDAMHRGNKPERLISIILNVSRAQAALIAQSYTASNPDAFSSPQGTTSPARGTQSPIKPVKWLDEFESIKGRREFSEYLIDRGFDKAHWMIDYYALACCRVGRWKQRIIIPIFDEKNNLIGWQGRAILNPKKAPRYLTSHPQVKQTVFNLQNINDGGEVLYICEGPFDAMKIDFYGKPTIRATCTFGVTLTPEQIYLLSRLVSKFQKTVLLFDADSAGVVGGFNLSDWLPGITFGNLPEGHKDTDKMNTTELMEFLHE